MNRRLIIRLLGAILCIEAVAMIPSFGISLIYRDGDSKVLGLCILMMAVPGALLWFLVKTGKKVHLRLKEGFIVVGLGWLVLSLGGALPFILSGVLPNFADALFESVSGFTTTGATVVTQFEGFPRGIMFWRASTHWVGGMGVLVLTLALLPKLTGRTSHLVKAESPGPSMSKLVPQTGKTAKILYLIYMALTVLEFLALLCCGLNVYDAALHALSTAGTGGFSNYGDSIAAFKSVPVEIVITVFMFLFGVNFALYYKMIIGEKLKAFIHDEEFRWYFFIVAALILMLSVFNLPVYTNFGTSLRYASFQVCSIISTTGFAASNFLEWPVISQMIIFIALFFGSCAGSTAGGMKIVRINLLCKETGRSIRSTGNPKKMEVVRLDHKAVDETLVHQVAVFAFVYIALVLAGGFVLSVDGKFDVLTNLSGALTCVSNVGPAFGGLSSSFAAYSPFAKLVCCLLMLAGRLELFPIMILFTRNAWKKY